MTRLKVCCIRSPEELARTAAAGARFAGLVGAMPSGPGPIPDERIRELAALAGRHPGLDAVLLTSRRTAADIEDHVRATGVGAVQLVRHLDPDVRRDLRARLPDLTVLQVLHVEDEASVEEVARLAPGADFLLLDSGRPGAAVEELGGTGRVHDWTLSRRVVERAPVPVLLAGGLTPENVGRAVGAVRPWGVDVCSGLRDDAGILRPERLEAFRAAVAGASSAGPRGAR